MYIARHQKETMDTTQLHIQNWQTFLVGQPRLLPNGGESYEILFDELADIIANNLERAEKCVGGDWSKYIFHHCINIDRGTLANPDTVRQILVYKIKDKLGIDHRQSKFREYFDFSKYFIRLSQELYHLVIRCRGIWSYFHSDWRAVQRGLTNVTKRLQWKYDKDKHASALRTENGHSLYDPYDLYEQLEYLHDDSYFIIVRDIILAYMQLQNTHHPSLKRQLYHRINSQQLWDNQGKNRKPRQIVADLLCEIYDKVTDNHLGHMESVKFL